MLAKALVIAMAADIARSDYAKPTLIRSRSREWLIACRWGPEGEYLSIATAGPITEPLALAAPQAITPIHSLFGVLVAESETQSTSTFLLVRQCLERSSLPARFFPPTDMCCCRITTISTSSARRATRIVAAGRTARKSARTFPIRRRLRPKRCHGISKRRGVTGSVNSFPAACRESGSLSARPGDEADIRPATLRSTRPGSTRPGSTSPGGQKRQGFPAETIPARGNSG